MIKKLKRRFILTSMAVGTLVLLLDPGCPSCHQALTVLSENPEWADVRRVAVICAPGSTGSWRRTSPSA